MPLEQLEPLADALLDVQGTTDLAPTPEPPGTRCRTMRMSLALATNVLNRWAC